MPDTPAKKLKKLTPRQQDFVAGRLKGLNITEAYVQAGFKSKHPEWEGSKLWAKAHIQAAYEDGQKERSERTKIDQDYVLYTIHETVERCRQGQPVLDRDGTPTGEWAFDAKNVLKGCDLLGKHLGMWDKKEVPPPPPTLPSYYDAIFEQLTVTQTQSVSVSSVKVRKGQPVAEPQARPKTMNQRILEQMRAAARLENPPEA